MTLVFGSVSLTQICLPFEKAQLFRSVMFESNFQKPLIICETILE